MKVLVLAGGLPQIALIKELKKRGMTVILADYYPNPVAKPYADAFYQKSTLDIDAIRDIAIKENVGLITTVCTDQALLTVSKLSEELGLPCYLSYDTGLRVTNKKYMKEIFKEYEIPTSNYEIIYDCSKMKLDNLEFPLVVKPVDCNSSKGVIKVTNKNDLTTAVNNAINFSRTKNAIIEEYKEGKEISVDVLVQDKKAIILATSISEKIKNDNQFVIFRGIYPADINKVVYNKIQLVAQKIVDAFKLENCPMLIQLINQGDEIFVLEFSARTGGGLKYRLIELASGVNIIKTTLDITLGNTPKVKPHYSNKIIANEFIYCYRGQFDHLQGFDECVEDGLIEGYYLFKNPGEKFDKVESSGDRIGGITIVANTHKEFMQIHNNVIKRLKVIDINGQDIMRHDLLPSFE